MPLSRVGYCNAALAPLSFPLALPFLILSLCSPRRWATPVPSPFPSAPRLPPRDHTVARALPFYVIRPSPSISLDLRLAFLFKCHLRTINFCAYRPPPQPPSSLSFSLRFSLSRSIWTPFSRTVDWRELLTTGWPLTTRPSPSCCTECIFRAFLFQVHCGYQPCGQYTLLKEIHRAKIDDFYRSVILTQNHHDCSFHIHTCH